MKIYEIERSIENIINVYSGHIPLTSISVNRRESDCFVYIQSGKAEYIFNNNSSTATSGCILFLSKNSHYEINIKDDNYNFICIDFNFTNEKNVLFENEIFTSKKIVNLDNTFNKIDLLWHLGNLSDKVYCMSLLYNIYSEIIKSIYSQYISAAKIKRLEKLSFYISENIDDPELNIKNLSSMCNMSEVHLRRLFSQVYHISPNKYITSIRLKKAKELLQDEKLTINEISKQCGFTSQYYFAKIFKSNTNLTPTEYRQSVKYTIT